MKNKYQNYLNIICCLMVICFVSCNVETLDTEEDVLISASSKGQKKPKSFNMPTDCITSSSTDLYAGQHILVGDVTVVINGDNYEITYNITNSGYCMVKSHLSVVESPEMFPMNNGGNPKNGHFEYSNSHDCASSYTYIVPTSKGSYIAAHAEVICKTTNKETIINDLPSSVSACVTGQGGDSYFSIEINSDDILKGNYNSVWCVDFDKFLKNGHCFEADVYASTGEFPSENFENPTTFGAINWIVNQDFVGKPSLDGGTYDLADVQGAIWKLVEEDGFGDDYDDFDESFNPDLALEIYNMALEHLDFVPECDDDLVIILIPKDGSQPIIISIPIECNEGECDETAWADGCDFPGNNWSTYFRFLYGD